MSHTFYNSLDLTCKSPFGAVKAGQPVTFNLTVPEDLGYVDPHLVLTKDREDPVHYRMEFTGQTPKVNHFALTVTPTTSGLYFYHFDLYTDFRRIYRTPGGEGVLSWTDGQDWQLTVYEPDFKTPDWLKNGTMYQIFPDRFCEGKPNKAMPFADRIYRADKTGEPYFWPTEQSEGYLNMDYYGGDFAGIQQKLPYLLQHGGLPQGRPAAGHERGVQRPVRRCRQGGHPHHPGRRVQPHGVGFPLLQPRGPIRPGRRVPGPQLSLPQLVRL